MKVGPKPKFRTEWQKRAVEMGVKSAKLHQRWRHYMKGRRMTDLARQLMINEMLRQQR